MGIRDFLNPKKPCAVCTLPTHDLFIPEGDYKKRKYLCRDHLVSSFSENFLRYQPRMVIVEFQPAATKYTGIIYSFYPKSLLKKFGWEEEDLEILEGLLNKIKEGSTCAECDSIATIYYLTQSDSPWDKYEAYLHEDYLTSGKILCRKCALKKLSPLIKANNKEFEQGLWSPYKEEGLYITTEI